MNHTLNYMGNGTGYSYALNEMQEMCRMSPCEQITISVKILEMCGLTISMVSICIALGIYYHYRCLRNCRTKIHTNLFFASLLHIVYRLILYALEFTENFPNTNILYIGCIILMEFSRTAVFAWNFIEGLYLHTIIIALFQPKSCFKIYYFLGWAVPAIMTIIWTIFMMLQKETCASHAWVFYSLLKVYWILEGLRCGLTLVNSMFLLNIVRILVVKLRNDHCNELQKLRKAVRGAIVLSPLLGISNLCFLIPSIYYKPWTYVLWAINTYFLVRFEGFFIVLCYCFLNEEVKIEIQKSINLFRFTRNSKSGSTRIAEQTSQSTKLYMLENRII